MKVLAFGSRGLRDERVVRAVLVGLHATRPGGEGFHVVCGVNEAEVGVPPVGADAIAWTVAGELDWAQRRSYPADWRTHAEGWCPGPRCTTRSPRVSWWCMVAGPRRNQQMIDVEHTQAQPIDLGVGFVDRPLKASRGSADMHRRLVAARIPTMVVFCPPVVDDAKVEHRVESRPVQGGQGPAVGQQAPPGVVPEGEPALDRFGRHLPVWDPERA